jgi:flagellar basal-body rod modification protein FlgD
MAVSGVNNTSGAAGSPAAAPTAAKEQLGKETFLKLLVAQIKNQNPLNPADGVQFVSQLAQFSELEQVMTIRQTVEEIRNAAQSPAPAAVTGGEMRRSG